MYTCINGRRVVVLSHQSVEAGGNRDYSSWPFSSPDNVPDWNRTQEITKIQRKVALHAEKNCEKDPFSMGLIAGIRDNITIAGIHTIFTMRVLREMLPRSVR